MASLNSIGPAVTISLGRRIWSVRFRLPEHVARLRSLPRQCRLSYSLSENATRERLIRFGPPDRGAVWDVGYQS